jgi:hypothetical protein
VPLRERLSLKLLLVFFGSFIAVLILSVAWTLLTAIADSRDSALESETQAPVIVIDPKIQADLAKALSFDAIPAAAEVQNPFIDRANIGSNLTVTNAPSAPATQTNAAGGGSTTPGGSNKTTVTRVSPMTTNMLAPEVDNTRGRWEEWAARANRGEMVGPESATLGIDDLVPVGYAGGGDRPVEVMLFSISLCRTFSFPAGTQFYNGTLAEINQNEVVFANLAGIRRKSYSTTQPCNGNSQPAGDQP